MSSCIRVDRSGADDTDARLYLPLLDFPFGGRGCGTNFEPGVKTAASTFRSVVLGEVNSEAALRASSSASFVNWPANCRPGIILVAPYRALPPLPRPLLGAGGVEYELD
jgi:hypothetical protein